MAYTVPTVADFKSRFDRDFLYSVDVTDMTGIRDKDVTLAITQAGVNFNPALWETQAIFAEAFELLAAHYLVTNITASSQGIGGAGQWLTQSKGAGSLAESYQIPERVIKSPTLALYSKTTYGCTYLSLLAVRLIGNFGVVRGTTTSE